MSKTLRAYIDGIVNQAIVAIDNAQEQLMFNVRQTLDALGDKADKVHTHSVEQISDLSRTYMATDIYWNADTNTPRLPDPTTCKGQIYIVSVPGTRKLGNVTYQFRKDDWVISTGAAWVQAAHTLPQEVMRTDVAATRTTGVGEVSVNDGSVLSGAYAPDLTKGSAHEVHLTGDTTLQLPVLPTGTTCGTMTLYITADISVGTVALQPVSGYRIMRSTGGLVPDGEGLFLYAGTQYLVDIKIRKPDTAYIQVHSLTDA